MLNQNIVEETVATVEMQEEVTELMADETIPEVIEEIMDVAQAETEKDGKDMTAETTTTKVRKSMDIEEKSMFAKQIAEDLKAGNLEESVILN